MSMLQEAERALASTKDLFDSGQITADELQRAAGKLCVLYNTIGSKSYKAHTKGDLAPNLFARAMKLTDEETGPMYFNAQDELQTHLRATTLNNMGCMERTRGNNEAALLHLRQCSVLESHNSPATNLNISAILTQMGRHAEAIGSARRSIGLLLAKQDKCKEDYSVLVIAYHNLAMAQECSSAVEDRNDAKANYTAALQIATKELGEHHPTTVSVAKSLRTVRQHPQRRDKLSKHKRRAKPAPTHENEIADDPPQVLPDISPLAQVSQAPEEGNCSPSALEGMMTAETLQKELNPNYSGDTGMILVDTDREARPGKKQVKKRRQRRAVESRATRPADINHALRSPQPPKEERRGKPHASVKNLKAHSHPPDPQPQPPQPQPQPPAAPPPKERPRHEPQPPKDDKEKKAAEKAAEAEKKKKAKEVPEPEKRARTRAHDETRDEDRKKEDAVTYMHQLLVKLLRDEDVYEQQFQAALRIQCTVRCLAAHVAVDRAKEARRREQSHRLFRENDSAKIVTRFIRKVADVNANRRTQLKKEETEHERRDHAAVRIQKTARGWLARRKTKWLRTYYRRVHWGTRVLQCFFRRMKALLIAKKRKAAYISIWQDKLARERVTTAATKIAKVYRGYKARLLTDALRGRIKRQIALDGESLRHHAATKIAATWRGSKGRAVCRALRTARNTAAERKEVREHRAYCASMIQDCWRRYEGMVKAQVSYDNQKTRVMGSRRQRRQHAALAIQSCLRQRFARCRAKALRRERRARLDEQKRAHSATIIAAMWRAVVARVEVTHRRGITNDAVAHRKHAMHLTARKIQGHARMYLARRALSAAVIRADQRRTADIFIEETDHRALQEEEKQYDAVRNGERDTFAPNDIIYLKKLMQFSEEQNTACTHMQAIIAAAEGTDLPSPLLPIFEPEKYPSSTFSVVSGSEGTDYEVLIQDGQRTLYIDRVFARILARVVWNQDTRYITLEGVAPEGSDTVQVAPHTQLEAVANLERICLCNAIPAVLNSGEVFTHNMSGAYTALLEKCVVRLQSFVRGCRARTLRRHLTSLCEEELQRTLRIQAAMRLQAWFRQNNARITTHKIKELREQLAANQFAQEEEEYQDAAAKTIAAAAKMRKKGPTTTATTATAEPRVVDPDDCIEGASGLAEPDFDISKFLSLGAPESQQEHEVASARTIQRTGRGAHDRAKAYTLHGREAYERLRPLQKAHLQEEKIKSELEDTFTIDMYKNVHELNRKMDTRDAQASSEDTAVQEAVNEGARRFLEEQQREQGGRRRTDPKRGTTEAPAALPPSPPPSPTTSPTPPAPEDILPQEELAPPTPPPTPPAVSMVQPSSIHDELQRTRSAIEAERTMIATERNAPRPASAPGVTTDLSDVNGIDMTLLRRQEAQLNRIEHDNPATRHRKATVIQCFVRRVFAYRELTHRRELVAAKRGFEYDMARRYSENNPTTWMSEDKAASRIQGLMRMRTARHDVELRKQEVEEEMQAFIEAESAKLREEASTRIQKQVRCKIARCDLQEKRKESLQHASQMNATTIQAFLKAFGSMCIVDSRRREHAAGAIQRMARSKHAHREADARRALSQQRLADTQAAEAEGVRQEEMEEAASAIQRTFRVQAAKAERDRLKTQRDEMRKQRVGDEDELLQGL